MGWKTWTALIFGVILLGINVLFYLQNSLRLTDLSLDLYVVATHLLVPLPVPVLLYSAFGLGLLVGLLLMGRAWRRASRRVSELEAQVTRGSSGTSPSSPGDLWT